MHQAQLRTEVSLGQIRPPQRLAPFSYAIGLEVDRGIDDPVTADALGDAFGRLIVLYDPQSSDSWGQALRMVAYIQVDLDDTVAGDPMLPDVAWEWLKEGLDTAGATFTDLGGTVTSTASMRFGDIGGPPRAFQLELRASWTAKDFSLTAHVEGFAHLLALAAGLPPVGVTSLDPSRPI